MVMGDILLITQHILITFLSQGCVSKESWYFAFSFSHNFHESSYSFPLQPKVTGLTS